MTRLIDDLLDVGRITRNKLELRREPVDVTAAVRQAVETCRPLLEEYQHRLRLDLPGKPVFVDADPVRITQVLGNLLNNACKFTDPEGEIAVEVDSDESGVTIRVSDNGRGIPADQVGSVFEMFSQVGSSSRINHSGLGIGLNLTKHLVELHDGTIDVLSDGDGRGSTFVIRLPGVSHAFEQVEPQKPVTDGKQDGKRKILVVDDNLDAAESLRLIMTLAGNETAMANDGIEAIERARETKPDIVLLDIGLPGADGYEVCRAIRAEPWGNKTYVVALTGWGQDEDRRRTKEAGFDAHLVKPVDPTVLLEMISKI